MLPDFNSAGDLPVGIYRVSWEDFQLRFGSASPRRIWLFRRFHALIELARSTGDLRRIFVWGSFVTAKAAPRDIDLLLIMSEDFATQRIASAAQDVFDSVRARLLFEADIFWARASIEEDVLRTWLETYQISRSFARRGIVEVELP